jgi:molybdenum cofactor guanylyltransferase
MLPFTVAIMAGGKSSRMGTNKAFVKIRNKPIVEHVLAKIENLGQSETLLITNRPDDYAHLGLPMVTDIIPNKASLGGIYTAIHMSKTLHTMVVACDMPFLNADLLRYMLKLATRPFDVVVPRVNGHPQGLHAIYKKNCLAPIYQRLEADRLKVIGFYDDVNVHYLDEAEYSRFDPKGMSFFNVNTPQDLKRAKEL